jgi:hypothetical protein
MLVTILTVAVAASLVPSVEAIIPSQVNIGYNVNGTGCPANSVFATLSSNFETLVIYKLKKKKECRANRLDVASTYCSTTLMRPLGPTSMQIRTSKPALWKSH